MLAPGFPRPCLASSAWLYPDPRQRPCGPSFPWSSNRSEPNSLVIPFSSDPLGCCMSHRALLFFILGLIPVGPYDSTKLALRFKKEVLMKLE